MRLRIWYIHVYTNWRLFPDFFIHNGKGAGENVRMKTSDTHFWVYLTVAVHSHDFNSVCLFFVKCLPSYTHVFKENVAITIMHYCSISEYFNQLGPGTRDIVDEKKFRPSVGGSGWILHWFAWRLLVRVKTMLFMRFTSEPGRHHQYIWLDSLPDASCRAESKHKRSSPWKFFQNISKC